MTDKFGHTNNWIEILLVRMTNFNDKQKQGNLTQKLLFHVLSCIGITELIFSNHVRTEAQFVNKHQKKNVAYFHASESPNVSTCILVYLQWTFYVFTRYRHQWCVIHLAFPTQSTELSIDKINLKHYQYSIVHSVWRLTGLFILWKWVQIGNLYM